MMHNGPNPMGMNGMMGQENMMMSRQSQGRMNPDMHGHMDGQSNQM